MAIPINYSNRFSPYIVDDRHVYRRVEIPNSHPKQWKLEEIDMDVAISEMIREEVA
tara:strand:+ start:329 stop:496 length:168 start_codon:yes stop_codon:yes gene_type:complete